MVGRCSLVRVLRATLLGYVFSFHHLVNSVIRSDELTDDNEISRLQSMLQSTDNEIARLEALLNNSPQNILSSVSRPSISAKPPFSFKSTSSASSSFSPSFTLQPRAPATVDTTSHRVCNGSRVGCEEGQLCVEGECRCPVLYTGPGCNTHIPSTSPCSMGMGHPRFLAEYGDKYKNMKGISELSMTQHIRMSTRGPDLTDKVDFSTCAVVGSSSSLKILEAGEEIDAHTAVIRFNDAPTQGFEQWVGSRTSLRIQNLDFCGFTNTDGELCYAYTSADRPCANWKGWRQGRAVANGKCTPLIPSHRNSKYIFWYWRMNKVPGISDLACNPKCGAKMSAGYFGLMLALNVCGKVDLYGFGSNSDKEQPHYFKKVFTWDRKLWRARHHWSFERHCIGNFRSGLVERVQVH